MELMLLATNTTLSETPGVHHGEKMDTSEWPLESTDPVFAVSFWTPPDQPPTEKTHGWSKSNETCKDKFLIL